MTNTFGFDDVQDKLRKFPFERLLTTGVTRWFLEMVIPRAKQTTSFENRTGLLRSVLGIVNVQKINNDIIFTVGWGGAAPYGKFQEFGTKYILPRKFMTEAVEREIASLPGYLIFEFDAESHASNV